MPLQTRRTLLLLAAGVFVASTAAIAAPKRKIYRVKPRKPPAPPPGSIEPQRKTVRTIRLDADWIPHPTFEQRWGMK